MTGVLAGIEDATGFDLRGCEYFVGTSAGSIVAAHLVAGACAATVPRRPAPRAIRPPANPVGPLASAALEAARRAGAWAMAAGIDVRAAGPRTGRPRRGAARTAAAAPSAPPPRHRWTGCAPRSSAPGRGSTGACAWCRRPQHGTARRVRAPPGAAGHRRPGGRGLVHRPVAVRARARSAAASTSTAACGARPTSTRPRPAATRTCCA